MEPIEEYIKDHSNDFNYLELEENSWDNLHQKMQEKPKSFQRKFLWIIIGVLSLLFLFFYWKYPQPEQNYVAIGLEEEMYFPELNLMNPDGESISVSDLKGKVVLVEFWASYCMACTQEHCYYFKPLYKNFKEEGFEIYSVSTDSSAVNWVHAIERDEMDWIHVSDLMGENSPTVSEFDVKHLPTNYLLNQEGKIIAKNVDVEKLEDTLKQLLAYNSEK